MSKEKKTNSVFTTIGASNHCDSEREKNDFYATHPIAVHALVKYCEEHGIDISNKTVLEPCCGMGHISEVLKGYNIDVISKDLVDRGYGDSVEDFLKNGDKNVDMHIITNPPYKLSKEFVEHSIEMLTQDSYVCMLLKLTFLESVKRRGLFQKHPPYKVLVFSDRVVCAKDGDFEKYNSSAICYSWFIWKVGYKGEVTIDWLTIDKGNLK